MDISRTRGVNRQIAAGGDWRKRAEKVEVLQDGMRGEGIDSVLKPIFQK